MYSRLMSYLQLNNILTPNQFGFREKHSTNMAIVKIVDQISEAIDKNMFTLGVFIDLSKALDTIDHKIEKLAAYGIRGAAYDWICSYLSCRKQYVQTASSKSDLSTIACGVSQGLGPLLFLLCINDLVNVSGLTNVIMFADDTNLFFVGDDLAQLESVTNSELDKISMWFKINKLPLNIKKPTLYYFIAKTNK